MPAAPLVCAAMRRICAGMRKNLCWSAAGLRQVRAWHPKGAIAGYSVFGRRKRKAPGVSPALTREFGHFFARQCHRITAREARALPLPPPINAIRGVGRAATCRGRCGSARSLRIKYIGSVRVGRIRCPAVTLSAHSESCPHEGTACSIRMRISLIF